MRLKPAIAGKFDVIIAGEVLKHLNAAGMFMKNCATMLNSGGRQLQFQIRGMPML